MEGSGLKIKKEDSLTYIVTLPQNPKLGYTGVLVPFLKWRLDFQIIKNL